MKTIPRLARLLLLALVALLLAGCAGGQQVVNDTADDSTIRPDPIRTSSGALCTPWVNNPHEADGSGYRACDYPIPQDRPVREPGMSDADWFLLGALFGTGLGHHDYYYSDSYYRYHIGPAWNRYPGSYYGYGRRPIVRVVNYNTVINHVNTTYAADEKRATADPKTSGYSSASGKKYNGTTVPRTVFKGSNVPVSGPAGDAPTAKKTGPTTPATKAATPTTPKTSSGSYSKPRSSTTTSRSSSSHSSSGRH